MNVEISLSGPKWGEVRLAGTNPPHLSPFQLVSTEVSCCLYSLPARGYKRLTILTYMFTVKTAPPNIMRVSVMQALLTAMTCSTVEVHGATVLQAVR